MAIQSVCRKRESDFIGDVSSVNEVADLAVVPQLRNAWRKFEEQCPVLTTKGVSLQLKEISTKMCMSVCMMFDSDTWAMKNVHVEKLETGQ